MKQGEKTEDIMKNPLTWIVAVVFIITMFIAGCARDYEYERTRQTEKTLEREIMIGDV